MANLTLVIDDDLLKAARIKALQEGTSVNELCRQAIERYAATADSPEKRARDMKALAAKIARNAPPRDPSDPIWPGREAIYAEAMAQRFPRLYGPPESVAKPAAESAAAPPAARRRSGGRKA